MVGLFNGTQAVRDDDRGETLGNLRLRERGQPLVQRHGDDREEDQQTHAHDDLRNDHRDEDERAQRTERGKFIPIKQPRAEGAEYHGKHRGERRDDQAVFGGVDQRAIVPELHILLRAEPAPDRDQIRRIERIHHEQDDRDVEKEKHQP